MAVRDYIIVHYHEIGLKGGNRSIFERALARNIARATSDLAELKPRRLPGRVLVPIPSGASSEPIAQRISTVFGIANYSIARGGQLDFDAICDVAAEMMAREP